LTQKSLIIQDLPLVLKLRWENSDGRSNTAYVGWAGGASSSKGTDILEIGYHFAHALGFGSLASIGGLQVEVTPMRNYTNASVIVVEPISSDDWEILVRFHPALLLV
jgi:hypothetical protein